MTEARVEFLWKAGNCLKSSEECGGIRSYLLSRCRDYGQHEINLPKKLFDVSAMCSKCSTPWSYGHYSSKVLPANRKMKYTLAKAEKIQSRPSRINKLNASLGNKLIMKCNICQQKSIIQLQKPSKICEPTTDNTPCVKKRMKKRKDKFAGLSESAVLSAVPNHIFIKKRLSFQNKGDSQNVSRIETPCQSLSNKKHVLKSDYSKQKNTSTVIPKNISSKNKSKKSKVLSKVLENKQMSNNSIMALAGMLKKGKNTNGNSAGLKLLLK